MDAEAHLKVLRLVVNAIREEYPNRLIIADGLDYGWKPFDTDGLKVAMSTRGYAPFELTHYRAEWGVGLDALPVPT